MFINYFHYFVIIFRVVNLVDIGPVVLEKKTEMWKFTTTTPTTTDNGQIWIRRDYLKSNTLVRVCYFSMICLNWTPLKVVMWKAGRLLLHRILKYIDSYNMTNISVPCGNALWKNYALWNFFSKCVKFGTKSTHFDKIFQSALRVYINITFYVNF